MQAMQRPKAAKRAMTQADKKLVQQRGGPLPIPTSDRSLFITANPSSEPSNVFGGTLVVNNGSAALLRNPSLHQCAGGGGVTLHALFDGLSKCLIPFVLGVELMIGRMPQTIRDDVCCINGQ